MEEEQLQQIQLHILTRYEIASLKTCIVLEANITTT